MIEEVSETEIQKKRKRKTAAKKAWKTIRNKKMEKSARFSKKLLEPGLVKASEPEIITIRTKSGSRIVHRFDKTPSSIACGPFWELRWAFGCPFDCAYCYLRGTMRGKMKPRFLNIQHVLQALQCAFSDSRFNNGNPTIFNTGELADSWMHPPNMIRIIEKFEDQQKHKVLTLTKFGADNPMLEKLKERFYNQTIAGFSINADKAALLYEKSAPSPKSRIEAASQLSRFGYDVRVRIDPIIPINEWKEQYQDLVYSILAKFEPNRIILGTPRGLRKTIIFGKKAGVDLSWTKYLEKKETGWGWKLPFEIRHEVYRFLYDKLLALGFQSQKISMCKETLEMWEAMGLDYEPFTCNCYGKG